MVKRACGSRSDHVCPASVRCDRNYDDSRTGESTISCSCCRTRNSEDVPGRRQRDECSGGDAIDTVPSREREEFPTSGSDKNKFVKSTELDRCDVTMSGATDDEVVKTMEWLSQSTRPTFYHHRKAGCPSRPCSNLVSVNLPYDAACEKNDKVAYEDSSGDKSKEFASTSYHGTSIDLDGNIEEKIVTNDVRARGLTVKGAWTKLDTLESHRKVADSTWRCQCELHPCEESTLDLLRSSCDRCHDRCHHYRHHCRDCIHRHCCCQRCDDSFANVKGREMHGHICDERAQHKSWRDQQHGRSRLYSRHCHLENSSIISAVREHNDAEREKDEEEEEQEEDDGVAVINHKDSMCILAEKYKAGRRCRGRRCEDRARSGDRAGKYERNKSSTLEIVDQSQSLESANAVPHGGPSVKHVCRAHRECRGSSIVRTCSHRCERDLDYDRLKPPLNKMATVRCCSMRASCKRNF